MTSPTLTRYGSPCATCGVLRDYHGLTPRDHAHLPPAAPTIPATRINALGSVVCADCGHHHGRHSDDCSRPRVAAPRLPYGDGDSAIDAPRGVTFTLPDTRV
jgi:hypothetical protein